MTRPTTEPHRQAQGPDGRPVNIYPGHQDAVGLIRGEWPSLLPRSREFLAAWEDRTGREAPAPGTAPRNPWGRR